MLLGAKLISEASSAELSQTLILARTRMNFLAWIDALLTGSAAPTLPFSFPAEQAKVSLLPGEAAKVLLSLHRVPSFDGEVTLMLSPIQGLAYPETVVVPKLT